MIIRRTLVLTSLVVSLIAPLASAQSVDHTDVASMVGAINAERARCSVPALAEDPRLDAIAESHSMEMARAHFFSHVSPSTGQPADRVSHAGLHWTTVAENIAINQSPEAAQQALLRSPGHHENMVERGQRAVGIGIVRQGDQVWVTQLFATLSDAPAAVVAAPPIAVAAPPPSVALSPADDDDEETDSDDDAEDSPPIAPMTAPMLPNLPVQGIPGLEQLLTGLGLARQPTPPAPAPAPAPAPTAARAAPSPQVYTLQTPFGPVRIEGPSSPAAPSAAAPTTPTPPRAAPPTPAPRTRTPAPARGRVVQIDTLDV